MSSAVISSSELFNKVAAKDVSNEEKLDVILKLKTHVKKDFVDIEQVPGYFEALSIAIDIQELGISVSSFSVISHLVKRVSMQDKTGQLLKSQSYLILPIIINRMGDQKSSTQNAAVKAIEAYWFSAPKEVEDGLRDIALKGRNPTICTEVVRLLNHFVSNVNQHFKLDAFLSQLVSLVNIIRDRSYQDALADLFTSYYNLRHNRSSKFALTRELELQNIPYSVSRLLTSKISSAPTESVKRTNLSSNTTRDSQTSHEVEQKSTRNTTVIKDDSPPQQDSHIDTIGCTDSELQSILDNVKYSLEPSIEPINFNTPEAMSSSIHDILGPFEGKETEFNWHAREKNILKLRSIMRGNAVQDYEKLLLASLKETVDGICKSVNSLRTTLSTNGCQLVKEMAVIFGSSIDSFVEQFMPHLLKLCSATKHIASTNANMAICAIFANCTFNTRLFAKIHAVSLEKNKSPRSYSGLWLQIMLIRFHKNIAHSTPHGASPSALELCSKVSMKLLGDPNPNVRQVGKDTFWCFHGKFPIEAENILAKLDPKVVKGLERSKPQASKIVASVLPAKKPKVPLKETIMEKNKEIRRRESQISRPTSRSSSQSSNARQRTTSTSHTDNSTSKDVHAPPSRVSQVHRRVASLQHSRYDTGHASSVKPLSVDTHSMGDDFKSGDKSYDDFFKPISSGSDIVATTEETKLPEEKEKVDTFDIQKDPILKFLSCKEPDLVAEGVNLLKYAILGEEELSKEVDGLLKKISITNPALLRPLITSSESLFKRSFQFFSSDDFFRLCSILLDPVSEKHIDSIISVVDVNQIYESITKLLSYTISTSNILENNDDLTIQIIRYKSNIIKMIVDFLQQGLDKIPISDSYFSKVTSNLFELFSLVKSTEVYDSFAQLMKKFYAINSSLFITELDLQDPCIKEEIEDVIGIDQTYNAQSSNPIHLEPFFDLTQVTNPPNVDNLSPVKLTTDFTMLLPVVKENNELTYMTKKCVEDEDRMVLDKKEIRETSNEQIEVPVERRSMDITPDKSLAENVEGPSNEPELPESRSSKTSESTTDLSEPGTRKVSDDEFALVTEDKTDPFARLSSAPKSSHSIELAHDFAQVKITDLGTKHKLDDAYSIQSLIDKVDPLKSVASRNKPIKIYQDAAGSPQRVKSYNYSDLNWFNFQVAKLSISDTEPTSRGDNDSKIQNFESICNILSNSKASMKELVDLLHFLQPPLERDAHFFKYLQEKGAKTLEDSMYSFFNRKPQPVLLLNGLVLMKQIQISGIAFDLEKLWSLMISLSDLVSEDRSGQGMETELQYALGELIDESLRGSYSTSSLLKCITSSLSSPMYGTQEKRPRSLLFILDSLTKVLSDKSISLMINDEMITEIDTCLNNFIADQEVEVRRCVIQSYGQLLKSSKSSFSTKEKQGAFESSAMNTILERMTGTQKKLVEYYSQS